MRFWLLILILMTSFMSGTSAQAQAYRREVSFEWEEMPDAKTYDVQIQMIPNDTSAKVADGAKPPKAMTFKTKEAVWSGKLVPGKYNMSLRARDHRGVPGDWSPVSEFIVNLDPVKISEPKENAKVASKDDTEIEQTFQWKPVNGANEYKFELTSEDGATKITETLKETKFKTTLPVAKNYTWKVVGFGQNDMQSDSPAENKLSVVGPRIPSPPITPPESEFVREVKWEKPAKTESFDIVLSKVNPKTRKYEKIFVQENYQDTQFAFDDKYEGGSYSLTVKAKANLRETSPVSKINFKVISGDRSPAAEYTALVRKSIDRVTGWYAIASYLITQIDYFGETPETGGRTTTTALGGTGRLGAGYFTKDDRWGFLAIADMSGFTISGANRTYSSLEVSGISRKVTGDRGELRGIAGLYYQELPQLIGIPSTSPTAQSQVTFVQSAVAGPHVGAEYWYSFTPKFGFQVNSHLYYSLLTMKSPNGNNVEPRPSYQVGLMGSYRFDANFTGLVGVTHRTDQLAYKANKTGSALEGAGDYNETRVTGTYLSFFAEYGF
jgi:hypothetical protein